jgi:hypothetical protein
MRGENGRVAVIVINLHPRTSARPRIGHAAVQALAVLPQADLGCGKSGERR